jgi:SAM-dependent methyltransferase
VEREVQKTSSPPPNSGAPTPRTDQSGYVYVDSALPFSYWFQKNKYYHHMLTQWYLFMVPQGATVLHLNCKAGYLFESLNPKVGVGVDTDPRAIKEARTGYGNRYYFHAGTLESLSITYTFDFIILSTITMEQQDVQQFLSHLHKFCRPGTRIIIDTYAWYLKPFVWLGQKIGLHYPVEFKNWISRADMINVLALAGFDVVTQGSFLLLPMRIPLLSWVFNTFLAPLPIIRSFCIHQWLVARSTVPSGKGPQDYTVSVVVTCRNERGNIERVVKECPQMGKHTEIIFVEGGSSDGTLEEIQRVAQEYKEVRDISWYVQENKGKGDAVRKGFAHANSDVLMILDGDLTMPAEELSKFFEALVTAKGEFINGSRLVYSMESKAMRFLNVLANRFFGQQLSWIVGQKIKDTLCGTKVLWKEDYGRIISNRSYFGMRDPFGDFDLLFGAAKLHLKIVDLPIRYKERTYGQTNIRRFANGFVLLWMSIIAMRKFKFR